MPSITFRDFELNHTTITGRRNPVVTVDAVRMRYKIDSVTRQLTNELEGTAVDIIGARGKIQTVKLPLSTKENVDKIAQALKENKVVKANFGNPSTLRGRCYAMLSNGQLLQGVSCTASELNIISFDEPEFDDFDIDIEI